jgi:diphthamide biosynthesis enzyme Dph1/Dph2-like protein
MCSMMLKNSNDCRFFSYNPNPPAADAPRQQGHGPGPGQRPALREETPTVNRALRGRYFCIEKAKEAEVYGIVVGTLSISGHLALIDRLKSVIKAAGKRSYTFAVGKINVPKLANFADIDVFIVVACEVRTSLHSFTLIGSLEHPPHAPALGVEIASLTPNACLPFDHYTEVHTKFLARADA